jgi:hypothetical protein
MSCCSSTSGNQCPTKMSDGRLFTDYRPRCLVSNDLFQQLQKNNTPVSSYESRLYLQRNAETIIERQKQEAESKLLCGPCTYPMTDPGTMLPEKYVIRCDNVSCSKKEVNPSGLGDGRQY